MVLAIQFIFSIILLFITKQIHSQGSSISFSPNSSLCIGEEVEMVCFVESSVQFGEDDAQVSINSSLPFAISILNSNAVVNSIDLSRYRDNLDGLSISKSRPGIRLIINSYQPSDSATVFGCHGEFTNFTLSPALVSGQPSSSAAVPFPPTSQSNSFSSLNAYTCEVTFSVSWTPNQHNVVRENYLLYYNGQMVSYTADLSYSYDATLQLDTPLSFAVAASNCAGNSSQYISTVSYPGYILFHSSGSCLDYNTDSSLLSIQWDLNALPYRLFIQYSLQLNITYTQRNISISFRQLTSFTLLSFLTSYTQSITPHNFSTTDSVETNITSCLMITQQCGQPYTSSEIFCSYSAKTPTLTTNSSPSTSLPTSTNSLTSPSTSLPNTTRSPFITTNSTTMLSATTTSLSSLSTITSTAIVGFACLITLSFNAVFILVIVFLMRKIRQLSSPTKPAPSHPYEYIDIDEVSGNISSPTQQQSPQDYVHMSSVHKQDTTQPPPFYANLK